MSRRSPRLFSLRRLQSPNFDVSVVVVNLVVFHQPTAAPPANPSSPLLLSRLLMIRLLFPNFTPTDAFNWIMQLVTVQALPNSQSMAAFCKAEL